VLTLGVLAALVVLVPVVTSLLGRASGWLLAAGYVLATFTFLPAVTAAIDGAPLEWSIPWAPGLGLPGAGVELAFRADGIGVVFTLIALVIGAVVLAYSTGYLEKGRQLSFYWLMTTFTLAMTGLVLTDDLLVLFVCWEATSLASFLLIARSGTAAQSPSMRTLLITFLGGLTLLTAIAGIIVVTGTTRISEALTSPAWEQASPLLVATLAVLVAVSAMTKSAQFPFHSWLPDAMAAATPVSAYLHAAAVVKAGIFLLIRFSPAFADVPAWNALLIVAGLLTTAIGGWFALTQSDIKKLMAYSTVSQLGLITAAIGVGTEMALVAAVLHVIAHALFKSGLFMMVGVIDHVAHTRRVGSIPQLIRVAPASFVVTVLGSASMAGIPPLLGFVSKESVFTGLLEAPGAGWTGWAALVAGAAASVLTFAYCAKLVFGAFVDGPPAAGRDQQQAGGEQTSRENPVMLVFAALPILASIPLAFMLPQVEKLVVPAVTAALPGTDPHPHLALWHGLTAELLATALILVAGVINAIERLLIRPARATVVLTEPVRAARHVVPGLALLAVVILGGVGAIIQGPGLPQAQDGLNRPIDVVVLVLTSIAVLVACFARSRMTAIVALSAVGILATVQIMSLGAPDVTLTQLLVEAMTIIIMMLVLQKLPRTFWKHPRSFQLKRAGFAVVIGLSMGAATWAMAGRRERSDLAMYYLEQAPGISGGSNIVNTILVEFRALDTLGELTVLGMAGIAIVAVMSSVRDRYIDPPAENVPEVPRTPYVKLRHPTSQRALFVAWPNVIPVQMTVRRMVPILIITSALVFWRGHNEPGGGFIAALIGSAVIGLLYMSTTSDRAIGKPQAPVGLIGGGVLIAVLTGAVGLILVGSFLQPLHGYVLGQHFTTSMLFDVGVYMAVLGLILISFNLLGTSDSAFTPAGNDVLVNGQMLRDVVDDTPESTRERVDEMVYGELSGPMESVRGERPSWWSRRRAWWKPKVGARTASMSRGREAEEDGS
jgi:multicomponent Na+:H+ antiporter subunit A